MEQYIPKSALVAEIKRLIELFTIPQYSCEYNDAKADGFREFLAFINTLEVIEVNLEKEIDKWYNNEASKEFENVLYKDIEKCAKHFFELGLKAQKG